MNFGRVKRIASLSVAAFSTALTPSVLFASDPVPESAISVSSESKLAEPPDIVAASVQEIVPENVSAHVSDKDSDRYFNGYRSEYFYVSTSDLEENAQDPVQSDRDSSDASNASTYSVNVAGTANVANVVVAANASDANISNASNAASSTTTTITTITTTTKTTTTTTGQASKSDVSNATGVAQTSDAAGTTGAASATKSDKTTATSVKTTLTNGSDTAPAVVIGTTRPASEANTISVTGASGRVEETSAVSKADANGTVRTTISTTDKSVSTKSNASSESSSVVMPAPEGTVYLSAVDDPMVASASVSSTSAGVSDRGSDKDSDRYSNGYRSEYFYVSTSDLEENAQDSVQSDRDSSGTLSASSYGVNAVGASNAGDATVVTTTRTTSTTSTTSATNTTSASSGSNATNTKGAANASDSTRTYETNNVTSARSTADSSGASSIAASKNNASTDAIVIASGSTAGDKGASRTETITISDAGNASKATVSEANSDGADSNGAADSYYDVGYMSDYVPGSEIESVSDFKPVADSEYADTVPATFAVSASDGVVSGDSSSEAGFTDAADSETADLTVSENITTGPVATARTSQASARFAAGVTAAGPSSGIVYAGSLRSSASKSGAKDSKEPSEPEKPAEREVSVEPVEIAASAEPAEVAVSAEPASVAEPAELDGIVPEITAAVVVGDAVAASAADIQVEEPAPASVVATTTDAVAPGRSEADSDRYANGYRSEYFYVSTSDVEEGAGEQERGGDSAYGSAGLSASFSTIASTESTESTKSTGSADSVKPAEVSEPADASQSPATVELAAADKPADSPKASDSVQSADSSGLVAQTNSTESDKSDKSGESEKASDLGGVDKAAPVVLPEILPEGILYHDNRIAIKAGEKYDLKSKLLVVPHMDVPEGMLEWISDDFMVVDVDQNGMAVARDEGEACVTVRLAGDPLVSDICRVVVEPNIKAVSIPDSITVKCGEEFPVSLKVSALPDVSENRKVSWKVSNPIIENISEGRFKAVGSGDTRITVSSEVDPTVTATCAVNVLPSVSGIEVQSDKIDVRMGENPRLSAKVNVLPDKDSHKSVTWSSGDESILRISRDGVVTPIAPGNARVFVTSSADETISDHMDVNVLPRVDSVRVAEGLVDLNMDSRVYLAAAVSVDPDIREYKSVEWSSSDPSVVSVTAYGALVPIAPGRAVITAKSTIDPSKATLCHVNVFPNVRSISLASDSASVKMGDTVAMSVNVKVSPDTPECKSVKWSVSDSSVIKVTQEGVVIPVNPGVATVTATSAADPNRKATSSITVLPAVRNVSLSADSALIKVGNLLPLASAVAADPSTKDSTDVVWTTSDASVATVAQNGIVSAAAPGRTVITATSMADPSYKASCEITVAPNVRTLTLSSDSLVVKVGESERLVATVDVAPNLGKYRDVIWKSEDESVAKIDDFGNVIPVAPGETRIDAVSVADFEAKASCNVKVIGNIHDIAVSVPSAVVYAGSKLPLSARVSTTPDAAVFKDVIWTSSNPSVAQVDSNGVLTGNTVGTAYVTARSAYDPSKTSVCLVDVRLEPICRDYMIRLPGNGKNVAPILVCQYEITQGMWKKVMGNNPSSFVVSRDKGDPDYLPVERVSWYDAIEFCNRLSELEGYEKCYVVDSESNVYCNFDLNGYRLPTEDEWEYAADGDAKFEFSGSNNIDSVAWHKGNSDNRTHEVGLRNPNGFGIYDMSGNVAEWCWWRKAEVGNEFGRKISKTSLSEYPMRGGSWNTDRKFGASHYRSLNNFSHPRSFVGLRVVRMDR